MHILICFKLILSRLESGSACLFSRRMRQFELLVRVKLTNQYKEIDIGFRRPVRAIRRKRRFANLEDQCIGPMFLFFSGFHSWTLAGAILNIFPGPNSNTYM